MIEIQGLSILYGKRKLAYPDISVKKGEAVGIAGKSGCGKTSLFSFLLGELPDSAFSYERAELLGRDLSLWGMERFEKISYIPQFAQSALNPRMKVREHIDAVLTLSGGQKQRIVIALAMLKEPELLFMDEPSSAIDFITLRRILEYIWSIKGTTTILMTAHQRPFLEKAVDRIVELWEG